MNQRDGAYASLAFRANAVKHFYRSGSRQRLVELIQLQIEMVSRGP